MADLNTGEKEYSNRKELITYRPRQGHYQKSILQSYGVQEWYLET